MGECGSALSVRREERFRYGIIIADSCPSGTVLCCSPCSRRRHRGRILAAAVRMKYHTGWRLPGGDSISSAAVTRLAACAQRQPAITLREVNDGREISHHPCFYVGDVAAPLPSGAAAVNPADQFRGRDRPVRRWWSASTLADAVRRQRLHQPVDMLVRHQAASAADRAHPAPRIAALLMTFFITAMSANRPRPLGRSAPAGVIAGTGNSKRGTHE